MTSQTRSGDQTAIPAVTIGTLLWLVAFIVVTINQGVELPVTGVWWWGACLIGLVSGIAGLTFLYWRRSRMRSTTP